MDAEQQFAVGIIFGQEPQPSGYPGEDNYPGIDNYPEES